MSAYTSKAEFEDAYATLFKTFDSGKTKSIKWRKWQLKQCWWLVHENEDKLIAALRKDLQRHEYEAYFADIYGTKRELIEHIENVEKWAADEIPPAGLIMGTLGKARIRKEPLGVALVIGPWNFPISLILQPMISAIAAGCCVMVKPSELAEASQAVLAELIPKYMDQSAIRIVTGGPEETGLILEHKFNHIFFTGSSKVARIIAAAAAKHLTPIVLELGGQGPAIVTKTADVDLAAKRIAYAKHLNAGQICLSVNHVYADPAIYDKLVERLKYWAQQFLSKGDDHMAGIINTRNYDRLVGVLKKSEGVISHEGKRDRSARSIQVTIVKDVKLGDSLLDEELFGPICPIVKADFRKAYKHINDMPHPLAIYIFSTSQSEIDEIINNSLSGGVTVNDVLMHAGVGGAPFGGVGESGYGYYHGIHGFLAFTHSRTVVAPPMWLDKVLAFRYPPYNVANKSKLTVKNSLGFKPGETLEDQRLSGTGGWITPIVKLGTVALLAGAVDWYLGGRLRKTVGL